MTKTPSVHFNNTIGERIYMARKLRGVSMRWLAKEIGCSAMLVCKYERGALVPSSSRLMDLAKALDVHIEFLMQPITVRLEDIEIVRVCKAKVRQ